jgi:capsular exopolysaccharide synthesis family protein
VERRSNAALDTTEAPSENVSQKVRPFVKKARHKNHDASQLNLRQLWRLVKINKYVVGSTVLVAVSITALHTFFATPIYRASVTMTVATAESKSLHEVLGTLTVGDDEMMQKMHALNEYFKSGEMATRLSAAFQRSGNVSLAVLSQKGIQRILVNLGLVSPSSIQANKYKSSGELAGELMSMLTIQSNFANSTLQIEAATPNPQVSAFLANEAAKALVEINHKVGLRKVTEIKKFLNDQAQDLGTRLQNLESELSDFQAKNQIISQSEAERSIYSTLDRHESQFIEADIRLSTNVKLIRQIEKEMQMLKANITKSDFTGSNLYLSQLQHRLSMLQYQQAMNSGPQADPNADSKGLQKEINGLVSSYQKALESRDSADGAAYMNPLEYYQRLEQSLSALKKDNEKFVADQSVLKSAITKHKGEFPKLASNLQHLTELKRNIQLTSDLYLAIRKKLQEAQIQEAGTINDVAVLTEAQAPTSPHAVSMSFKIAFSMAIGLFFGILFVLTHEALVPAIRHRHDIEQNGIYVLGEIPLADPVGPSFRSPIPIIDNPNSYEADAFRFIRMRLSTYTKHKPGQEATVILITSPRSANGKTFTSVNLATTLSKAKLKTLLIDMDLRKPSTQKYFEPSTRSIEVLTRNPKSVDYASTMTPVNPHLDVIFGTHHIIHPPEFLESEVIPNMITELRKQYDFIIIDSAPILGIIDSSIVAKLVDHVLFVVEHRKTLREDLAMALHTLREVHHKPLLSVLNCVHKEFGYYDNKYYVVRSSQLQTQDLG